MSRKRIDCNCKCQGRISCKGCHGQASIFGICEIDFFRYVAKQGNCADFRTAFVKTIEKIIILDLDGRKDYSGVQKKIAGNLIAVSIAYAYLDWLSGDFDSATLDDVISTTKDLLKDNLANISFVNHE